MGNQVYSLKIVLVINTMTKGSLWKRVYLGVWFESTMAREAKQQGTGAETERSRL